MCIRVTALDRARRKGRILSIHRKGVVAFVAALALVAAPSAAWGHGMHYIGTLTATGDGGGTVSATTGQGVTGTEPNGTARPAGCAGAPTSGFYGPYDQGYNARNGQPEPVGCVDVHTTTGATFVLPTKDPLVGPTVTISGSGYRPNTTFGVTYLFPNDPGDLDGDAEGKLPTDTNDPFCHRLYFQAPQLFTRDTFTTTGTGSFGPRTVQLAPYEIGGDPLGNNTLNGQLCISSQRFDYRGPVPPESDPIHKPTSQGQSVPIKMKLLGV